MALLICFIVESFYSQVRKIFPHIYLRDLPCNSTKKILLLHQISLKLWLVLVPWLQQTSWIRTYLCSSPQYLCWLGTLFECNPNTHGEEMMLVLPSQRLPWEFSKSVLCFLFCLPVWHRPHTLIRIVLFHDVHRDIHNLEFSPSHVSIGFSQIAFPIIVLPEDDRTDPFREERLGLQYWTMILAICVVVDESKCLDTPILDFLKQFVSIFHLTWVLADTASAACPSQPGSLEMISMILAAVIWDAEDPCSVNIA